MILDQRATKQFQKLDGICEKWANAFGMNAAEMRCLLDAVPGCVENGYTEALVGVDGDWRGIAVRALSQGATRNRGRTFSISAAPDQVPESLRADDD